MTYSVKILGFGDNVVDKYEHIKTMFPGGNTVNFAVYGKRAGAERAAYMGIFGNDAPAQLVIESLAQEGIETVKCRQMIGENGAARVTVVDGDRVFIGSNEGGVRGEARYVLDQFDLEYIRQFDVVHTGNYCFTERELHKIKESGVPISFDFSDDSSEEYYDEVAPFVDFAFFSAPDSDDDEAVKERLARVVARGPSFAAATRGEHGCIAYDGTRYYGQPAKPVEKMEDTMGAGDSFLTSFVVKYLSEMKEGDDREAGITAALDFAADFASQVCGIEGSWGHGRSYE